MKSEAARKVAQGEESDGWPRKVKFGRVTISIYRRITPNGEPGCMVANYVSGKRRFDSYPSE